MSLCDLCGGACCRFIVVRIGVLTPDQREWASLRGTVDAGGNWRVKARCAALGADGRCTIYERRPGVCREYEVGGQQCQAARKAAAEERNSEEAERG